MNFYANDRFFGNIKDFLAWMTENEKDILWDVIIENSKEDNYSNDSIYVEDLKILKVNRSKRTLLSRDDVIDIGILRNPKDERNAYYYENGLEGSKEEVKRPKLFIYVIDKNSKVTKKYSTRTDLEFESDIIGLYMYIPNTDSNNKNRMILTQVM